MNGMKNKNQRVSKKLRTRNTHWASNVGAPMSATNYMGQYYIALD